MQKKIFFLDAYALIYRAYYTFIKNPRRNTKGFDTSAAWGFTNTLNSVLREYNPDYIGVVFDPAGLNFRHELYPDYKANRPPTPESIKTNIPYIKDIIRAFSIPVIEQKGYEADDLIGTLAKKAEKEGLQVYMMTPDKDYLQLVSENIFVLKPAARGNKAEIIGIEQVREKFGVERPEQVIEVLAMWGDSSDNVPGIPGIGEKKAKKYVKEYGSLKGLYENIDKIKGKQKINIEQNKEQAELSHKLVEIELNVPIDFNKEEYKRRKPNLEALLKIFDELEFRSISQKIKNEYNIEETEKREVLNLSNQYAEPNLFSNTNTVNLSSSPKVDISPKVSEAIKPNNCQNTEHSYKYLETEEEYEALANKLNKATCFCFDTETTGLDVHADKLVGISFSYKAHEAYYISLPDDKNKARDILNIFSKAFNNKNIEKIGQNIKFDLNMIYRYGLKMEGKIFDTMIAHYLLNPEKKHNIEALCKEYLNYEPISIEELIEKKGKGQKTMKDVEIEKITEYAAEDADLTFQLMQKLKPLLEEEKLIDIFYNVEMPLTKILSEMELNGVKINTENLKIQEVRLREKIKEIEAEIYKLADTEFNISSPKQLGEVIFEKLSIVKNPKRTKTKQYSTSEKELQKLKDKHPIIGLIFEYRSLKKLLSSYVESLPKLINKETGLIHTSYNQAVTATGRLSSNNPNLQNIPIRTEEGRAIREVFVSRDENHILLAADYSQIELRLTAHLSGDENMIEAFRNEADIHSATAAKIYKVSPEEVTREMRNNAKSANFGIIYMISAFGLSQNLNIKRSAAKQLIDSYFETYPKTKIYIDESIKRVRKQKYVKTIVGRKRYFQNIDSMNSIVRSSAERNSVNTSIQGSAADIIKIAMVNICKKIKENKLKSLMIMQVHDELVFDVLKTELEQIKQIVKTEMEQAVKLSVPLTVDIGLGENWLEAH